MSQCTEQSRLLSWWGWQVGSAGRGGLTQSAAGLSRIEKLTSHLERGKWSCLAPSSEDPDFYCLWSLPKSLWVKPVGPGAGITASAVPAGPLQTLAFSASDRWSQFLMTSLSFVTLESPSTQALILHPRLFLQVLPRHLCSKAVSLQPGPLLWDPHLMWSERSSVLSHPFPLHRHRCSQDTRVALLCLPTHII